MDEKELVQKGNTLQVKMGVMTTKNYTLFTTNTSQEYVISGSATFQVKVITTPLHNVSSTIRNFNNLVFVKFVKLRQEDELTYTIRVSSNELEITNKTFFSDDGTWHLVYDNKKQQNTTEYIYNADGTVNYKLFTFDITVHMDIVPSSSSFATLHGDMELTDFELRGEDGSVHIHRAVLAASSPVLRRMLGGKWRESTEGHVDIPGTSKCTLQHLKDYVYLHILPETGIEQLLLLGSYYMMPDLELKCVDKLVDSLTAQNACDILEFATKHKVTRLMLAIFECVENGAVKVNDMREHFLRGDKKTIV